MTTALNRDRLEALYPGEPDMVAELLREAVATVSELISKLAYSIESSAESARLAHEIKGVSLMTGAEEIAQLSSAIEQFAKSGRTDETRALVSTLREAEQRLIDEAALVA